MSKSIIKEIFKEIKKIIPSNKNIILVHFNVLPLLKFNKDIEEILNLLCKELKYKTIIMPAFTWSFSNKRTWDYHNSKSECGIISELFRKKLSSKRTVHPVHSLSVYGPNTKTVPYHRCASSFGHGSTWEWICESDKVLNLSIGSKFNGGATFIHYLEEYFKVPYRSYIKLTGDVFNNNNKKIKKDFFYYARKKNIENNYIKCEKFLINKNILKYYKKSNVNFFCLDITKTINIVKKEMTNNINFLKKI